MNVEKQKDDRRRVVGPGVALLAGGISGIVVDLSLFPIDTIKTRLQSPAGFEKAGGLRRLYRGLPVVLMGSAPDAALFFMTYETLKSVISTYVIGQNDHPLAHCASSVGAELTACTVRVPMEQLRVQLQAGRHSTLGNAIRENWIQNHGGGRFRHAYRAYVPTALRDVPFSFVQFPIYEALKLNLSERYLHRPLRPIEGAACGSIAGAFAASLTTPLDVCKTRMMLSEAASRSTFLRTFVSILRHEGQGALFKGVFARMVWMSAGGFVLFGSFEACVGVFSDYGVA